MSIKLAREYAAKYMESVHKSTGYALMLNETFSLENIIQEAVIKTEAKYMKSSELPDITIADNPQSGDDLDTWERIGRLQTMLAEDARMIQHLKGQIHDLTTKIQNHSKYIAPCDGCNGLHHIGADCPIPTD